MSDRPEVVLISEVFRRHPGAAGLVEAAGFTPVERFELVHRATADDLAVALRDAWAVVAGAERYTADLFPRLPGLRAIARPGVGVDAIDLDAAAAAGVAVVRTPGANDESVADHALALMLAVLRRLRENDISVRAGTWREAPIGRDLAGLRVGIVGLGAIGRAVARRLVGFGCELAATDPAPDRAFCQALSIELLDLPQLASRSDILTIHAPLLATTRSMIDRAVLDRLASGSILVNTSRGPVVDEDALIEALRGGRLAGAGVDVYREEPIGADHPLAAFPNVVMTGHVASFSEQGIARMTIATIDNLRALAAGTTPAGLVEPAGPGRPA